METHQVLKQIEKTIEIQSQVKFDPSKFYKTAPGLYVFDSFRERIIEKASPIKKITLFNVTSFDLINSASDESIESQLPEKHIFSESDVCALIASMIVKQSKGEDGNLIVTGYANIFYTPAFVVYVRWRASGREWYVSAWGRGGSGWAADGRVFSPATDL